MDKQSEPERSLWEAVTANDGGGPPRCPIECLNKANAYFDNVVRDHDRASDGYRERLYQFLQTCYWVGQFYTQDKFAYRQFKMHDFWRSSQQKPKGDQKIMKWVVYLAMRAITKRSRDRAGKCWKVLDHFLRNDICAEDVVSKLREGGVDGLHDQLPGHWRATETKRDDLELLRAAPAVKTAPPPITNADGAATSDPGPTPASVLEETFGNATPPTVGGDNSPFVDHLTHEAIATAKAAGEPDDVIADESRKEGKSGPLNRIDLDSILAIDLPRHEIDEALAAKWVTIYAKVEPADDRGWVRVVAHSMRSSDGAEHP